jgi:hypothetical protein
MSALGHFSPFPVCQTDGESAPESGHLDDNIAGLSPLVIQALRSFALSSIVCLQAGPPGQTLRARRICLASALRKFENREVSDTFPPARKTNPPAHNACYL